MGKQHKARHGSLQFYPRVRAKKFLPSVNWKFISKKEPGLLGFIGYKVEMASAYVRDNTMHSLTKGKRITMPVTIIDCPTLKILSIRFYKGNKLLGEVLNQSLDKELKRKIRLPKKVNKKIEDFKDYDDLRVVIYSQVKKTGLKKTPDISEVGLFGNIDQKLTFVKENLNKEISIKQIVREGLVDFRGVTKGKGTQGATKRFGLNLKFHKSEKGLRNPGSGGAWHPARVEYTHPMAGQMGFFTRVTYNHKVITLGNTNERDINPQGGFKRYGKIKGDYLVVSGSVQGPSKRQLMITLPSRGNRFQLKKNYEFIELR